MTVGAGAHHTGECGYDETMSHCWAHNVDERIPKNVYRVCFECGHVWTARSLRRAFRRTMLREASHSYRVLVGDDWCPSKIYALWRAMTIRAKTLSFCEACIHDW